MHQSKPPFFALKPKNEDEKWMLEALKEAWKAFCEEEVPVGAILVYQGKILARGHNQVEILKDATAHAEMLCMTAGSGALSNWRLAETTLYSTVEPCSMCLGALLLARVPRLVWGAPDLRHGANGSWVNLLQKAHPMHTIEVSQGVLQEASSELLRSFFKQMRNGPSKEREHASRSWELMQELQ